MNDKTLREKLKAIASEPRDSIRKEVAQEIENHSYDEAKQFFQDLLQDGCISGMVSSLIYYADTYTFYQKYYHEIEEILIEYEEMMGEALKPQNDLMNWYAWFAFEEFARKLAIELDIIPC